AADLGVQGGQRVGDVPHVAAERVHALAVFAAQALELDVGQAVEVVQHAAHAGHGARQAVRGGLEALHGVTQVLVQVHGGLGYVGGHRPGDGAARADDVRRRAARGGEVAGELFERGEQGRRVRAAAVYELVQLRHDLVRVGLDAVHRGAEHGARRVYGACRAGHDVPVADALEAGLDPRTIG